MAPRLRRLASPRAPARPLALALALAACRDPNAAAPRPDPAPPAPTPAPADRAPTASPASAPLAPDPAPTPDPAPLAPDPAPTPDPVPELPPLALVDRPITYDDNRRALTLDYRRRHEGSDAAGAVIEPRLIVLHHTGGSSLDAAWRYFDRPRIEAARKTLAGGGDLNVSAHFLVDRDGTIVRLMPETAFARHCVGLNHLAIGVENIGDGKAYPLTDAQVEANAALVRHLVARHPITHLIGHHEAPAMERTPFFRELDPTYRTRKGDPGPAFLARVRARLTDLDLQGPPP